MRIQERLLEASKEWEIEEKVVAVVHDNVANKVLASEDLGCFGHTLQLALNAALDLSPISRLTAICRKIVGHFKQSVVAMGALRERQRGMNTPQHSLLQDVAPRWNSTYCTSCIGQTAVGYLCCHP